jgi:anti-anti-sigma regulatory factor
VIRINIVEEGSYPRLVVEGTLSSEWVEELRRCWVTIRQASRAEHLGVDLSGVSYIDDRGKEVLKQMFAEGAKLRGAGVMTRAIIDEIVNEAEFVNELSKTEH